MKLTNYILLSLMIITFTSCKNLAKKAGEISSAASNIGKAYDPDLTKQETFDKAFADLKTKLNGATKINQASFSVSDDLGASFSADVQSTTNPKSIVRYTTGFTGTSLGGPQPVEISYTGNAEDFKIEDFLFDINEIQIDKLSSTVKDAIARVSEKCTDVKVQGFDVEIDSYGKPEISISIDGKLKSNGIKDDFYCTYDLQGKFKSM